MDDTQAFDEGFKAFRQSLGMNVYHVADALRAALTHPNPVPWILGWLTAHAEWECEQRE